MTAREELLQYLATHPYPGRTRRQRPAPPQRQRFDSSAECWAFIAGTFVGVFIHTIIT